MTLADETVVIKNMEVGLAVEILHVSWLVQEIIMEWGKILDNDVQC